jgi:energy-coupling factor transporter ATP-binding protein EcfA2
MPPLIAALPELDLVPVGQVQRFRDVPVAARVRFNQVIVTGPPGCGKSTFIRRVGGWPEEGYVDLSRKGWWRAQALAVRPREVHLGLPFVGRDLGLALFEPAWIEAWDRLELEPERIQLPDAKRFPLAVDWRRRFVFEFLLPAPEVVEAQRRERARRGTHPVDRDIDLDQIREQMRLFGRVAAHFHAHGMQVYVRQRVADPPLRFAAATPAEAAS